MNIVLAFAPFIAFAVLDRLAGPTVGLVAGALVAAALLVRDLLTPGRSPKIIEFGTALLFGVLAVYALLGAPNWSVIGVRLAVDGGLLLIVLISMVIGRPFTLQYAREQIASEYWTDPAFIRVNYLITGVWALAFAVLVAAELAILYVPGLPPRFGIVMIVLALVGAVKFTGWYPEHVKGRLPT